MNIYQNDKYLKINYLIYYRIYILKAIKTYKYRIYPSKKQSDKLDKSLYLLKDLHNELLEFCIDEYRINKKSNVSVIGLKNKIDYLVSKDNSKKYLVLYSQVRQENGKRLALAYAVFFRRIKEGAKKKGFPRFKSDVSSMTYPQSGFKFISDKRLYVSKIGNINIVKHRDVKGKIKILTLKKNKIGQWYAYLVCEQKFKIPKHQSKEVVGIDLGLTTYAVLSDGSEIANPRHIVKCERTLKRRHRQLSRTRKGSFNRQKAKYRLAKSYLKLHNQRMDFLHKTSDNLTKKYKIIAMEDLNIKEMVKKHHLSKNIHDASWGKLKQLVSCKAVTRGGNLLLVDPKDTSRMCSKCKNKIDMPLSKRHYKCPSCGNSMNRDLNASLNIKCRAGLARTNTPVEKESLLRVPKDSKANSFAESGTICLTENKKTCQIGSLRLYPEEDVTS